MSHEPLTRDEVELLQEALNSNQRAVKIRLREGEYQHSLAKTIASFQLQPYFPDVKDITGRLFGAEKAEDTQFIRKIQTVLKKMEKSNVVKILKKKKPWELQRYALSSFKFQDVDNNSVVFATELQLRQADNLLQSILSREEPRLQRTYLKTKILALLLIVVASYTTLLWDLTQPALSPAIFIPAFSLAVTCSLILGKVLSQE